jgi:hypothetical protein
MPAGIETHAPASAPVEPSDLSREERPQAHSAHPGFWPRLATYLTAMLRAQHGPVSRTHRPCEPPMDRLIRESPSLSVSALAII